MRILCIGDSNTWGFVPGDENLRMEKRWTKILSEIRSEDEIIEEGLCGRTITAKDTIVPVRCGVDTLPILMLSHVPVDLVIIMLGTNDLKKQFNPSAKHLARGMEEFIKYIRNPHLVEGYKIPKILVVSPVYLRDEIVERQSSFGEFDENSLKQSKFLPQTFKEISDKYEVDFLNAARVAEASPIDCIHLDEKKHEQLGRYIASKVSEILDYEEAR
ncbi:MULTISPECIES: GDSL-type esterase/lipase family protein [Gemella]|uniref:GDSL-type esterase/lipase family protein n=1 Tax=Gemella TaxID=1378 RepID=UPI0007684857|nr:MULTISPECIES: GDSL-type esterase/lipase family protein [Gemella]AME09928.1 GDSL family lipase [Gemella sp. oral taxon 928]AXI26067.1 GDSL family lipase [Gemella sp. ND 6198]